jgi:hypothetical protein
MTYCWQTGGWFTGKVDPPGINIVAPTEVTQGEVAGYKVDIVLVIQNGFESPGAP